MLANGSIRRFYFERPLKLPFLWDLGRKHFRVETSEHRFVKLNKFENRLSLRDLAFYYWKLAPLHVYFSVLNWLFPKGVGKKYKAKYCVPLNGRTGLICSFIGDRKDLEKLRVSELLERAKPVTVFSFSARACGIGFANEKKGD